MTGSTLSRIKNLVLFVSKFHSLLRNTCYHLILFSSSKQAEGPASSVGFFSPHQQVKINFYIRMPKAVIWSVQRINSARRTYESTHIECKDWICTGGSLPSHCGRRMYLETSTSPFQGLFVCIFYL